MEANQSSQFAALFRTWLEREGITRSQAAARLGTATQMPYDYSDGKRLPQRRLIPDLAARMGLPVEQVQAAVEADRVARQGAAEPAEPAAAAPTTSAGAAGPVASSSLERW